MCRITVGFVASRRPNVQIEKGRPAENENKNVRWDGAARGDGRRKTQGNIEQSISRKGAPGARRDGEYGVGSAAAVSDVGRVCARAIPSRTGRPRRHRYRYANRDLGPAAGRRTGPRDFLLSRPRAGVCTRRHFADTAADCRAANGYNILLYTSAKSGRPPARVLVYTCV